MKKNLLYLFACLFIMSLTVACGEDEFDFKGTILNPIENVEIKNGNVIYTVDSGEAAEIFYYNFVDGKLDNVKAEVHYKEKKLADIAYSAFESLGAEGKELMTVKKDGKVLKIDYKKESEEFSYYEGFTAQQLADILNGEFSW